MTEIIISLTSTSKRINNVHLTIKSLINQRTKFKYKIFLYISKEPYLLDDGVTEIPNELLDIWESNELFDIFYTKNIGSYRKLIPLLKDKINSDTIIITVDDDKIYQNNLINRLVSNYYKFDKKYIIANRAFIKINKPLIDYYQKTYGKINYKILKFLIKNIDNKKISQNICFELGKDYKLIRYLSFLEGNDGVLYHSSFFDRNLIFDIDKIKRLARSHDDFWFKIACLKKKHHVVCVSSFDNRISKQLPNTNESGLCKNINKGTYNNDLLHICKYFFKNI